MGNKEANRLMDKKVTCDISVPAINIHLLREFDIRTAYLNPIVAYRCMDSILSFTIETEGM